MTNYLIRRIVQMALVILLSAVASYALLNFAPGGPLSGLRQIQQGGRNRITEEDIARIRAYFELDLDLPVRFLRWFAGGPRGPLVINGQEYFGDLPVGCRKEIQALMVDSAGNESIATIGCAEPVVLRDLVGRRTSNGILFGDFGLSWRLNRDRPVSTLIASRLPSTLQLMSLSILFSLLIGVPIGIYSALRQYTTFDYIFTTAAFMGSSMPTFFFGIMLIVLFCILPKGAGLPFLPPGSSVSVRDYTIPWFGVIDAGGLADQLLHLVLPVTVLTIVNISGWSRYVRGQMLEVLRQDFVRTARAKGLVERVVVLKHALRNALIPFVTIIVFAIPAMFGGAIITESIFSWPGMGRLYFSALGEYDYPVAMSLLLITSVLTVVATLLSDLLYTVVDPRIRYS